MNVTAGHVGVSQPLTIKKQTFADDQTAQHKTSHALFEKDVLPGQTIFFGNVHQTVAEARLRQQNQEQLKEEDLAIKGYPEYRELMLGKIKLAHNQSMTGMEFLQLIHQEQFYKKFGLRSNAKRLAATALCATVLGPLLYDAFAPGWSQGFNNIRRQFNFGVHLPTLKTSIGVLEEYDSILIKIRYSGLVVEDDSLSLIRLTPKGVKVLKNYEAQQKNGLLTPGLSDQMRVEKEKIQEEVVRQEDQLTKLTAPVFPESPENKEFLTLFQLLKAIQDKPSRFSKSWFSQKMGRGVSKQAILQNLGKGASFNALSNTPGNTPSHTKQLQFNHALTVLVEMALLKGNAAATHFQLTDAGKALLQHNLDTPNIPLLKETARVLYKKELAWYSDEKEALRQKLDQEKTAHDQIKAAFEKIQKDLQTQYQRCQQLNAEKNQVAAKDRPAYLTQVDRAVKQYRELANKVEFHQTQLLEQEKQYDAAASRHAASVHYLEKQAKGLQQKLWMLDSHSVAFKSDEAMKDIMALAHQRFLYQNGLVVDLSSNPTDEEVSRILCEVSIEGALEEIVSKPPSSILPSLSISPEQGVIQ